MYQSTIRKGHLRRYRKGNHCRIAIKAFIDYGDIGNTYVTPARFCRGANKFLDFKAT